jgi:2-polyprenyl-3-methyl-5-hydroxy-6-metoxy-1,4-benzoquinol methylase
MQQKGNKIENWNDAYYKFRTFYSEAYDIPDNLVNTVQFEFVLEDIERYLTNPRQGKILECGCGGARTSLYLARRGFNVTCSDFAPEAIRLASDNFSALSVNGNFVQDDLLNSKLPPESFDCVMSFGLLEHFQDLDPILAGISRLVKPGGIQIHDIIPKKFSTQTIMNVALYPLRFAANLYKGRYKRIFSTSYRDFPHYENRFTAAEYRKAFEAAGNTVLRCEASGTLYPFFALPFGAGTLLTKGFSKSIVKMVRKTNRTESKLMHLLAPSLYIVCRKNG